MKNLEKFRNKIKKKCSIGTWMQIDSDFVAKNISLSNAEWVVLDFEHGFFDFKNIPRICEIFKSKNKFVFSRLCYNTSSEVKKTLEAGCDGIIFPRIDCEKKLNNLILNSIYPPIGKRSFGFSYDNEFGKDFKKFKKTKKPLIIAMIETIDGVLNLDNILKVKHLDGLIIGNYDLMLSWKSQKNNFKSVEQMHDLIFKKAKKSNKVFGLHIVKGNKREIEKLKKKGCKFLPISMDTVHLQNIL